MSKLFYHPILMPSDKLKILLSVETPDGIIASYKDHKAALHHKICQLILQAWQEGYDVPELVEAYLGETIEHGGFSEMAWQITELPAMQLLFIHTIVGWNQIEISKDNQPEKTASSQTIGKLYSTEKQDEGMERTSEFWQEMSLPFFLEQLSMLPEDLI